MKRRGIGVSVQITVGHVNGSNDIAFDILRQDIMECTFHRLGDFSSPPGDLGHPASGFAGPLDRKLRALFIVPAKCY